MTTRSSEERASGRSMHSNALFLDFLRTTKQQKTDSGDIIQRIAYQSNNDPTKMTILSVLASVHKDPARVKVAEAAFCLIKELVQQSLSDRSDLNWSLGYDYLMKCIVDAGGISLVVTIMKNNPHEKGVQTEGRALFDLLCKAVKQNPEKEGIKAILLVMETLSGDAALQNKFCETLKNVAITDVQFRRFIGEAGGIPLIVAALKNHPNDGVLEHGLRALAGLTFEDVAENRKRVADAGGIAVVVNILERYDSVNAIVHPIAQEHGWWVLKTLVSENLNGVKQLLVDAGAIPVVVKAMNLYPNCSCRQRVACELFESLSKGGNDILAAMNEAGARTALSAAMDAHPNNAEILSRANQACFRLGEALVHDARHASSL